MRGLVLAGGSGTRLRPLTHTQAKQLLPVANRPIVFYVLDDLAAAGVTEVVVIVAPQTGDEIREAIGDGSRFALDVTYVVQDEPKGLAHAVLTAEPKLRGQPFVMYLGDNVLEGGVRWLVEEFELQRPAASILLVKVPDPRQFGVAELRDGRLVRLVEKPAEPPSDLALVGVYLFDDRIFDAAREIAPSRRGELEIADAIQRLLDAGLDVRHHVHEGFWLDTGKKDDVLEANRVILSTLTSRVDGDVDEQTTLQGMVIVEAGARVERSVLRGPVIVGAGARIVDASLGPHASIAEGCRVRSSVVRDSILLPEARVEGVDRLVGSLIGRGAEVTGDGRPGEWRLMVGDLSTVDVRGEGS